MTTPTQNAPIVNVTITPVPGTGQTQLGMFMISVTPINPADQILNLQLIVSTGTQPQGDFVAFTFVGNLPAGAGLSSMILYASCNGITANQAGVPLTVMVVGAITTIQNVFSSTQTYAQNLWPGGTCNNGM